MVRKICLSTLVLLSLVVGLSTIAQANTNETKPISKAGQPIPRPDRHGMVVAKNMDADTLTNKVDLPNLPDFTGQAKFIGGLVHQADRGTHYVQHFTTKQDSKLVLDWYLNTLNMYKWKINYSDKQSIASKQGGATCSIFVQDISDRKSPYKSDIEINYFLGK
ncbi:hypothetical protein BH10CYA1_BH10CYA1_42670 [soil metagenome]